MRVSRPGRTWLRGARQSSRSAPPEGLQGVEAEAKIEEQTGRLDELRAKAKGASADAQLEAEEQVGQLEEALRKAKRQLDDIAEAADDAWEDVGQRFDRAWEDVSSSAQPLLSRFS